MDMSKKLPQGWKKVKLEEVAKVDGGYAFKSKEFVENEIPIVRIGNITERGIELDNNICYSKNFSQIDKYCIVKGDILIAMSGATVGKLGMYSVDEVSLLNQRVGRFNIKDSDILNNKFLLYLLKSHTIQKQIVNISSGCAQPNISGKQLESIEFNLPPIEEQERIVAILERAESAIQKRKESNRLLDELVKSKFVEIFGNPSLNPKGWKVEELSKSLVNIENGKSFVCENYNREGIYPAILKLSAVTYGVYNSLENKSLIDKDSFVEKIEVKAGDLLFARKNTPELVGMSAYVYETAPNLMMPDLIFRLNTNENCNKIYLWKLINHDLFREKIKSLSNGSAKSMSNISKERLMKLKIPVPPIEFQNEFADFVKQVDKLKFEMENSLKELENNFNSLMQRAFKGEL